MSLTQWKRRTASPTSLAENGGLARLRDEMDQTISRFFDEPWGLFETRGVRPEGWLPPVDIRETDKEVTIQLETPGVNAADIEISLSNYLLTISGKKNEQKEEKNENFYQCERRFGAFRRVIELPETINPDQVVADMDNGVLNIRVAKKPEAKPRVIEVKPTSKKVAVNT